MTRSAGARHSPSQKQTAGVDWEFGWEIGCERDREVHWECRWGCDWELPIFETAPDIDIGRAMQETSSAMMVNSKHSEASNYMKPFYLLFTERSKEQNAVNRFLLNLEDDTSLWHFVLWRVARQTPRWNGNLRCQHFRMTYFWWMSEFALKFT